MVFAMDAIQVDAAGLAALAGLCQQHAAVVGAVSTSTAPGGNFQPSAAAVEAAHGDVAAAGARLAARMASTAAEMTAATAGFTGTDHASAGNIAAVGATAV
jgi:hypothetical protein